MRFKLGLKLGIIFGIFLIELFLFTLVFLNVYKQHDSYTESIKKEMDELVKVRNIQLALANIVMPANDFLIFGSNKGNIKHFVDLSAEAENLIDGILQYSKVGRIKDQVIQIDLNEVVTEAIDMACPPENIIITIEDKLPVIKAERTRIIQIFKIFQTLSPKDEVESTGIGLTVVKRIIELYGGEIWLESQPGQGTTFFFTLPTQESEVLCNAEHETDIIS